MKSNMQNPQQFEDEKQQVALHAAMLVHDGMLLGLGSGTTAELFVRALGERIAAGMQIRGVASSARTAHLAERVGITLVELTGPLDLAIDGADAVETGSLAAIKGHGGALAREKIVAAAADRFVLIVDSRKVTQHLQDTSGIIPLPVEVLPFGWELTRHRLREYGEPRLRERDGQTFITDNGNYILDLYGAPLSDAHETADRLAAMPGVVDHGLFLGMAELAIVGSPDGVRELWPTH